MSKIKLRWKTDLPETEYERGVREALERAINVAGWVFPQGTLARGIRDSIAGATANSWREVIRSEGLEIVREETVVRFEELQDGDLVRFPVAGFEYHTVHQKAVWILAETEAPRKVPISRFERIEVWRSGKWLKVVE